MAARAPLISVPKNLYKHFAVLTVAITACVAIFANGENQQAITKQIEQHHAKSVKRAMPSDSHTQQSLGGLRDNRGSEVSGGDDIGGGPSAVATAIISVGDANEGDFASALRRGPQRPTARSKLPPVLPPGMPSAPSLPAEAASPAMAPGSD